METKAGYTIVGAFVLAFLAGFVVVVVWLADVDFDSETQRYHILFDGAVTGLKTGNPVRYRGIPVGVVTDMEINPDNVEQVRVTIEVPVSTPIKEDAVASLEFQGLTGVAFVQIAGGSNEAPALTAAPGEELPVIASTPSQLEELFEQAPELLSRFIALVDRANSVLSDENRATINSTLQNIDGITGALAESSGDLRRILSESGDTLSQIRSTAEEAEVLIGSFAQRSESIASLMEQSLIDANALLAQATRLAETAEPAFVATTDAMGNVGRLAEELEPEIVPLSKAAQVSLNEFNLIAKELRTAAANIGDAAGQAGSLLEENRDSLSEFSNTGLFEFTQLISESRILVQVLTRISNELERDPARFLFGDQSQGFAAE